MNKICPVSGMFLEEPENGESYWMHDTIVEQMYYSPYGHFCRFEQGNCFATREDAERYAKHLNAMAKLRRLALPVHNQKRVRNLAMCIQIITSIDHTPFADLTPEEQNALLWPNEEKYSC